MEKDCDNMNEPNTIGNQLAAAESIRNCVTNECGENNVNHRKNGTNTEQILQAIVRKAIDLIFRTEQRIEQEAQILSDLECILTAHELNLTVMPFGSSTYGFGGPDTDFNICLLTKDGKWFIFFIHTGSVTVTVTLILNGLKFQVSKDEMLSTQCLIRLSNHSRCRPNS